MNEAQLITGLLLLAAAAVVVIVKVGLDILREMSGLGDKDKSRAERRTEERKNERIRKEIERWRNVK